MTPSPPPDPSSGPLRGPALRGAERREAILDAAVRLFSRRGWRATGLIGLAKEVGLTHSGLLHHFSTKENLLRAVVARRDTYQTELIAAMGRHSGIDVIREVLPKTGADQLASEDLTRLFTVLVAESLEPDEPLHDYFQGRHRLLRAYYAHNVRQGQANGDIRADVDPEVVAAQICAFITGLQTLWLLDPEDVDLTKVYDQQVRLLLEALAPPTS